MFNHGPEMQLLDSSKTDRLGEKALIHIRHSVPKLGERYVLEKGEEPSMMDRAVRHLAFTGPWEESTKGKETNNNEKT
ncbi:hypothetical protein J1N35_011038 [Gossypium stocksii]|uniref:Uncharacterized protein n=1 Tax=Gossypium stocksii TaxID=47602 RepID=A0A9D3W398_9ROSI|nr:hypothetical protein J1N35_011038 [Gossypium stocksii]